MEMILTHTDFDGVVCGTLLSIAEEINYTKFVSTRQIWYEKLTGNEIIADLPCPWKCKLWFDHHESNINEMKLRGVMPDEIAGKFRTADSCAQVIYEYYSGKIKFPDYFKNVIDETNLIDSMKYGSIKEWLEETPVKKLSDTSQFLENEEFNDFLHYLIKLSKSLARYSPEELIQKDFFKSRYKKFKEDQEHSLKLIKQNYYFHQDDKEKSIAIIDTSEYKIHQRINKNLVYLIEPEINSVLLINSIFKDNIKTNDLKFSFGINFTKADQLKNINLSEIFEELGIGGGHPRAAGGSVNNDNKQDKLKNKKLIIKEIITKWKEQIKKNPPAI